MQAEYISAGANRHPATADWCCSSGLGEGLLAYGSGRNVAIWDASGDGRVVALLVGHADTVNAVKFLRVGDKLCLLTGSVDKTVRLWELEVRTEAEGAGLIVTSTDVTVLDDHQNSINCLAIVPEASIFASGSTDGTVRIWKVVEGGKKLDVKLLNTVQIKPRFFPLGIALCRLGGLEEGESYLLAVAGTSAIIQLYVGALSDSKLDFQLKATLSGHEGWIRCLSFIQEPGTSDWLLASASQDKYIRLWRIHQGTELPVAAAAGSDPKLGAFLPGKSLSNKAHRFTAGGDDYSATFEALLLGHDDWIYTAYWRQQTEKLQLLSASADNSLAIWEQDPVTSIWVTIARLGEISGQKGSTTATGSTGGFWTGLWSPSGNSVTSLGRTGSWRVWNYSSEQDRWSQVIGVSGHIQSVTGIAWSKDGDYLLSTSSDQTTRLHACWKQDGKRSWHEMARPQIHGYDLNCIDSLGKNQFVSGADEKLLRVFTEPKAVATLLERVCGIQNSSDEELPDAANMPVLGLSNKAVEAVDNIEETEAKPGLEVESADVASAALKGVLDFDHPPLEDQLSKNTLWPEIEKLYGHGYEISALAASHDSSLVATACKASSIDHAVIRLYTTKDWREIKPPLTAHSLTVTRLRFSPDDKYLLSVGRDRQWALFERGENGYTASSSNPKGHTRMILDAAWLPIKSGAFVTAGRDKTVKLWSQGEDGSGFVCKTTIAAESPVTAVDVMDTLFDSKHTYLALGTEAGQVEIYKIWVQDLAVAQKFVVPRTYCPSKGITQLAWRPTAEGEGHKPQSEMGKLLAIASEDFSLRLYSLGALITPSS
jgi:elongator complex protein 2